MSSPSHHVFLVKEFTDKAGTKQKRWTKIAALFPNKNGKGFDYVHDGKIVIREPLPKRSSDTDIASESAPVTDEEIEAMVSANSPF